MEGAALDKVSENVYPYVEYCHYRVYFDWNHKFFDFTLHDQKADRITEMRKILDEI